ncbi:MAG: hypothetical protein ACREBB_07815 [Nitrosotalea sp.]
MARSSKSFIGIGIGLAAVIAVAVFFVSGNNNTASNSAPLSVPPNQTQPILSNATQVATSVHHYEIKVGDLINVGERT